MAYAIKKVDVWAGEIEDRPGGLVDKLTSLSGAGANFEFLISRRAPDKPGTGVVFLTPIKGAKQKGVAQQAGLSTTDSLHSLRVEGPDRAGLGTKMTRALADAGINLRGISAAALGRRAVTYFAFDSAEVKIDKRAFLPAGVTVALTVSAGDADTYREVRGRKS